MQELDRTQKPETQQIDTIHIPQVEVFKLANGIVVHAINASDQEVIKIDLVFQAGIWQQPQSLVGSFASAMLNEGTQTQKAIDIAEKLDYYGSYLKLDAGRHSSSASLYSLHKHLDNTLPVLEDIIKHSTFPEEGLQTLIDNRKQDFLISSEKTDSIAFREFNQFLYGEEHPYGKLTLLSDFKKIKREKLLDFYHSYYTPENCIIIISGNVKDGIIELLDKHFGQTQWRSEKGSLNANLVKNHEVEYLTGRNFFMHHASAQQASIRIGNTCITQQHSDYAKLKVVNTLIGGYFGSRLMSNLREEKGYTYGIGSALISAPKAGGFMIATEVGTEFIEPAVDAIFDELDKLSQDLVSESELQRVKSYMMGETLRFFDGPFAIADLLRGYLNYGKDLSHYNENIEAIHNITSEDVRSLSQKYFNTADFIQVVVGKKTIQKYA